MAMPPPGPTDVQFGTIGNASEHPNIIESLRRLAKRHGDVVQFNLGRTPCVLVNGALHVHNLFSEHEACLRKPEFVKDSNRGYWGDGLTTLEGAAWRSHRRMLLPSFSAMSVEAYLPVVAECTKGILDAWAPRSQADLLRQLRFSLLGSLHELYWMRKWRAMSRPRAAPEFYLSQKRMERITQAIQAATQTLSSLWFDPGRRAGWTPPSALSMSALQAVNNVRTCSQHSFCNGFPTTQR